MARRPREKRKPPTPFSVLRELHEIPAVGVRDVRERFKEACESGVPLIICRGRTEVAAFIPLNIPFWASEAEIEKEAKALIESAKKIAQHLGRS